METKVLIALCALILSLGSIVEGKKLWDSHFCVSGVVRINTHIIHCSPGNQILFSFLIVRMMDKLWPV